MTVDIVESQAVDTDLASLSQFADATLAREGLDTEAHVTITFVSPDDIAILNERHMGKSGPTDVLSFPIEDAIPGCPPQRTPDGPPLELGDIVISADVVAARAAAEGVSFDDELHLMVCHGLLHILGWDHQTDAEAIAMEAREADHLATVGRTRR